MAKYTSEATFTHQNQNMDNADADHTSATIPSTAIPVGRRSEARKDGRRPCSYEIRETIEHESVVVGTERPSYSIGVGKEYFSSWPRPLTRSSYSKCIASNLDGVGP